MKKIIIILFIIGGLGVFCVAQHAVLYPEEVVSGVFFGKHVFGYGDYIVVGAPGVNTAAGIGQSAYVFRKEGGSWVQEARLTGVDTIASQCFGCSVAAYENYILVGDPGYDEIYPGAGTAYVFKEEGGEWVEQAKLMQSDPSENQQCGTVTLFGDYAVVGCATDIIDGQINSGSAYVYKRNGDNWVEEVKLVPSDPVVSALFGLSVALNQDYIFVGAPSAYHNGIQTGAVYVFQKVNDEWIEQTKLVSSDIMEFDAFHRVIATENTLFVGAARAPGNNDYYRGAGYLFTKDGDDWVETEKIIPDDIDEDRSLKSWGFTGEYMALASSYNTDPAPVNLFKKNGTDWEKVMVFDDSAPSYNNRYGHDLFLTNDYLVVGAYFNFYENSDSIRTGAVYIYDLNIALPATEPTANALQVQVYPNPTSDLLNISLPAKNDIVEIQIYHINGQLLQTYTAATSSEKENWEIDIRQLPQGAYIVRGVGDRYWFSERFLKM